MAGISWNPVAVFLCLVATLLFVSTCSAVECYECAGNLGQPAGDACAQLTSDIVKISANYCYTDIDIDGVSRGGMRFVSTIPQDYCSNDGCYCSANLCNNIKLDKPSLTCYECQSVSLLDNGCGNGDYWNEDSKYHKKTKGCNACIKTQDDERISRGCVLSMHSKDINRCTTVGDTTTCICTKDNCNHASHLIGSSTAYLALTIGFVWKYLN